MAQLFRPGADTIARIILIAIVVLPLRGLRPGLRHAQRRPIPRTRATRWTSPCPSATSTMWATSASTAATATQGWRPAAGPACRPTSTCMTCHSQIWTNAKLLAPVRESFAHNTPDPLGQGAQAGRLRLFRPLHPRGQGRALLRLPRPVHQMALMNQNAPLTMGWCLSCHRNPGPHLAPRAQEYNTAWTPADAPLDERRAYVAERHIQVSHLHRLLGLPPMSRFTLIEAVGRPAAAACARTAPGARPARGAGADDGRGDPGHGRVRPPARGDHPLCRPARRPDARRPPALRHHPAARRLRPRRHGHRLRGPAPPRSKARPSTPSAWAPPTCSPRRRCCRSTTRRGCRR